MDQSEAADADLAQAGACGSEQLHQAAHEKGLLRQFKSARLLTRRKPAAGFRRPVGLGRQFRLVAFIMTVRQYRTPLDHCFFDNWNCGSS